MQVSFAPLRSLADAQLPLILPDPAVEQLRPP